MTKRIEIFRPGRFTATDGSVHEYSAADLEAAVAAYNEHAAAEPAPLVIGHPKLDHPAYGWVKDLAFEGGIVTALPDQVEPAFGEMVDAGRYKRISATWYPPTHPSNPKPGVNFLKHVGFLGAHAPALRGLAPVQSFSEAELQAAVTIDLTAKENEDVTDRTAEFAERETALDTRTTALDARDTALKAREATIIAREKQAVHDGNVAFAEAQVEAGKLAPAGKALVVGLFDQLATLPTVASFGEENGELAPADALKKLFEMATPIVSFGEAAPADRKAKDADPAEIADKARVYVAKQKDEGRTVSFAEAVHHVMHAAA